MIDEVYQTLLVFINKELDGHVKPEQFNLLAKHVQLEIFREYFSDENRDKLRRNSSMINKGYANLPFNERQKIIKFAAKEEITGTVSGNVTVFDLPEDIYFIEDDGVNVLNTNRVVQETERSDMNYVSGSLAAPSAIFPIYEHVGDTIEVLPNTITDIKLRYLRKPLDPKWTYQVVSNVELFDPSNGDFQDFELHPSEFTNIVIRMLSSFGLNIREADVLNVAETLKDKANVKENS